MRDKMDMDVASLLKEFQLYDNPATEKQKAILDAAEELFSQKGFDGAPTAEIAKRAKVTERTLFKHFPSKQELLKRVIFGVLVKTVLPVQLIQLRKITKSPFNTFRELIFAFGRDRIAVAKAHAPRLKILLLELIQNEKFRAQFIKLWKTFIWDDLIRAVENFQKDGTIRKDLKPEVIVQLGMFTIIGFALSRYLLKIVKPQTPEQDLEELLTAVLTGLEK